MIDPAHAALVAIAQQGKRRADPLAGFEWPSEKHRTFTANVFDRVDSVLSAANQGAKTFQGAAICVALSQARERLGDLRLPTVPSPNVIGVCVESHKVQVDSSQAAILHWLGDYPHDIGWLNSSANIADTIFVATRLCRHGNGERCGTCSRIVFASSENPDRILGARWLGAWGDEPPPEGLWDEARKNARYKWITETPLEFSKWEWIERQYAGALGMARDGRFLIRASLDDNKFLTDERKRELREGYRDSPFRKARETGEPVDAEGATPWGDLGFERLQAMLAACREGEWYDFPLAAAHRSAEKVARLEVWAERERDETYYAVVDASLGIADDEENRVLERGKRVRRDPSGLHVYARRTPRLVARYGGFLVPEVLGHLAARVGEMYGGALVDVENQGGYGEAVISGLHHAGYRYLVGGDRMPSKPHGARALAFQTNNVTRGLYIGAAQDSILHGGIEIASRDVIRAALSMRVDASGKVLARAGMHDEDVILWGRAAYWLARNPAGPVARETDPSSWLRQEMEADLRRARAPQSRPYAQDAWE
jgi:hypothetical protein